MSGACADAEVHLAPGAAGAEVIRPPGQVLLVFFILVTLVEIRYTEYLAANRLANSLDIPHPS